MSSIDRPRITDLLPTHEALLRVHRPIIEELLSVAISQGIPPSDVAFIVATTSGDFGAAVLDAGPGAEFVMNVEGTETAVVPLGVAGLVVVLKELIPEATEPVLMRQAGTLAVLVVDGDDEPAVALLAIEEFAVRWS